MNRKTVKIKAEKVREKEVNRQKGQENLKINRKTGEKIPHGMTFVAGHSFLIPIKIVSQNKTKPTDVKRKEKKRKEKKKEKEKRKRKEKKKEKEKK